MSPDTFQEAAMIRPTTIAAAALGATLAVGAVGLGTAVLPGMAGAQATAAATTTQATDAGPLAHRAGRHPRLRAVVRRQATVAADAIGIPVEELRDAVKGGQSVAEVAESHGVSTDTVVDAVVGDLSAKLDQAAADGRITEERAATVKERLPTRVTNLVTRHRVIGVTDG